MWRHLGAKRNETELRLGEAVMSASNFFSRAAQWTSRQCGRPLTSVIHAIEETHAEAEQAGNDHASSE
jgi:hypothetical protein